MKKGFYVYKHLNLEGEVIYVGRTINMDDRQWTHSWKAKHKNEIESIEYATLNTKTAMMMYEFYYISKYNPKNNIQNKRGDSIEELEGLPELKFEVYTRPNKGRIFSECIQTGEVPPKDYKNYMSIFHPDAFEDDELNEKQRKLLTYIINTCAHYGGCNVSDHYIGLLLGLKMEKVHDLVWSLRGRGHININYIKQEESITRVLSIMKHEEYDVIECLCSYVGNIWEKDIREFSIEHGEHIISWKEFREL